MEANELRIGNLIYGVSDRVERITYLTERLVKTNLLKLDAESQILSFKDIEPIPLTEEWLLKFGFEIQVFTLTKRYKSKCGNLLLYIMPDNVVFANGVINDIRLEPVHQLQNLYFALTNEELTIKQ